MPNPELVRLENVTKTFSGVKALDGVDLTLHSGEVLALVGENGAGKSTLMKILSGVYPFGSYGGTIRIEDKEQKFYRPHDAEKAGISIIHQELSAFSHLSVAENLFVGHWPTRMGLIDWDRLNRDAQIWIDRVGANCQPTDRMGDLSVGIQQMIEIAKALSQESKILILDEPTSALTPKEVDTLFILIRKLRQEGKGLIYISHKMEEIYEIADRMTILRDGKTVHTALKPDLAEDQLIRHMVGRSLDKVYPPKPLRTIESPILEVKDYSAFAPDGKKILGPVSFSLRRGEILGFSGLLGAGRSELMRAIFGDSRFRTEGEVKINGQRVTNKAPRDGLIHQISFVCEDRKRESILPGRSLDENVSIARLASQSLFQLLSAHKESKLSSENLKRLNTKCVGPHQTIETLSGGNQQKVIIARSLQIQPDVMILDEPTRGVDVGAKFEIYEILFDLAAQGKGLLVVSSDLPELMALADRIIVMSEGRQTGLLEEADFSQETIMTLAVGRVAEARK